MGMKKVNFLVKRAFVRNKGYFLTNIIVVLIGILIVLLSFSVQETNVQTILLSIGTSIIAASIVSFLDMLRGEGARESDEAVNDIVVAGGLERIYKRRDLEEYAQVIKNAKKSIDITGYSLRGFYESNKDIILEKCKKNKKFNVRIILVNPNSEFSNSRDKEENEQGSELFKQTYSNLVKWSNKAENIRIKLIDAPLSDMVYRIDDVMYTGPYFYRTSSKETYTNRLNRNGWLFSAYQDNFDRMWEAAKEITEHIE